MLLAVSGRWHGGRWRRGQPSPLAVIGGTRGDGAEVPRAGKSRGITSPLPSLRSAQNPGSGCRVNGRRSRSRSDAEGAIDAKAATGTMGAGGMALPRRSRVGLARGRFLLLSTTGCGGSEARPSRGPFLLLSGEVGAS